jgi:flavin reductase (DIM6/NTAB) family NADH-FMN oxidoreductase RutF
MPEDLSDDQPDLALLDPTMIVVTASDGRERDGCLVGFHAQASIEPLQHCVWLSKANHTFELARGASHLGVHLLTGADHDLAERFGGQRGDEVDKFAGLDVTEGPGSTPLLTACPNRFVLRVHDTFDVGGDHVAFVGTIAEHHGLTGTLDPLRLHAATDIEPGHAADD